MARRLVSEFLIPKAEGRAFELTKGQFFRVIEIDGKQVGDMTSLNLHDFRERLSPERTATANNRCFRKATKLYSGSPWERVMMTVIDDKVGVHWIHSSRCCRLSYKYIFNLDDHRNCQDNLAECLGPYGIADYDIPGTFNIFMNVEVDEDCHFTIKPPASEKGDYIEFRAEMDLLVAISACPNDCGPTNDGVAKPLKIGIFVDT
ncbi:MAG: urea carboxylase-associated family protein [Dehalococcoidia bacterium]